MLVILNLMWLIVIFHTDNDFFADSAILWSEEEKLSRSFPRKPD